MSDIKPICVYAGYTHTDEASGKPPLGITVDTVQLDASQDTFMPVENKPQGSKSKGKTPLLWAALLMGALGGALPGWLLPTTKTTMVSQKQEVLPLKLAFSRNASGSESALAQNYEANLSAEDRQMAMLHDYLKERVVSISAPVEGDVQVSGVGAGFVYSEDGYIVTNRHVVEVITKERMGQEGLKRLKPTGPIHMGELPELEPQEGAGQKLPLNEKPDAMDILSKMFSSAKIADTVKVKFSRPGTLFDFHEVEARVVGVDPFNDLAVLKVETGYPLPFLKINPDEQGAAAGTKVVAMGHPIGHSWIMTSGTLSGKNQIFMHPHTGVGIYDQTDADITQGFSGGPMVNLKGEVVGINTMVYAHPHDPWSTGFLIPIQTVVQQIEQIIKTGKSIPKPDFNKLSIPVQGGGLFEEQLPQIPFLQNERPF